MAKKTDKYAGMADMFEQINTDMLISQKTREFEAARARIQAEIDSLQAPSQNSDSGLTDIEDRNYINSLNNEMRALEQKYNQEIAQIKQK